MKIKANLALIASVRWNEQGLIPAIAQEACSGDVLMLAWMNEQALRATLIEKRAVYWSRSRRQLWRKGEESGNRQLLIDIHLDCDSDAVLLRVEQVNRIACHLGLHSCFARPFIVEEEI